MHFAKKYYKLYKVDFKQFPRLKIKRTQNSKISIAILDLRYLLKAFYNIQYPSFLRGANLVCFCKKYLFSHAHFNLTAAFFETLIFPGTGNRIIINDVC